MTITLSQLGQASADDNQISETDLPNMLTVGDSVMWGQGLRPDNRFREIVRQRLSQEGQPIRELSMARSGAKMHPALPPDTDNVEEADKRIIKSFASGTIEPIYSPEAYAREIPYQSLSTIKQLRTAHALLDGTNAEVSESPISALSENASPNNIRWVLLNGGLNDFFFANLLAPLFIGDAWHNDILAGWIAFIEEEVAKLGPKMEATLREATTLFPKATIVVNGYYPLFSVFSLGHKLDWYSVILGHADNFGAHWIERLATNPITKPMLIEVSNAFRWASDIHIQNAIEKVNQEISDTRSENQQPRILFAYSNIEKHRCLFAQQSWLWGFARRRRPSQVLQLIDVIRNPRPFNLLVEDLVQIAPNLSPEDEVIQERRAQCISQFENDFTNKVVCRLASLGHPNSGGAQGYANSIVETLEMFGAISSDHHRCILSHRRRRRSCRNFASRLGLRRVQIEANMGRACSSVTRSMFGAARSHWDAAIDHTRSAAANIQDAAACFDGVAGSMASASQQFFENASSRFRDAADNLNEAVECWDQTALDMQACDDQRVSEIAQCEANHQNRLDNECNIQCNSFTNCSDYGVIRRAACRTARAGCVALAATARATCRAGSVTLRETCKAAAHAKSVACKGAVVLNNTVCTAGSIGSAIGNTFAGLVQVIVGVAAGIASLSSNIRCAVGNIGRAFVNIGRGIVRGAIGTVIAAGAVVFFTGCTILRRTTAILINGIHRILDYGCRIGNGGISGICWITSLFSRSSTGTSNVRA